MTMNEIDALLGNEPVGPTQIPFSHVVRYNGDRVERYYPMSCMRLAAEFLLKVEIDEVELSDYVTEVRLKNVLSGPDACRVELGKPTAHSQIIGPDVTNWVEVPVLLDGHEVESITFK